MIKAASTLAYFKRKFVFKSLNENKLTDKSTEMNFHLAVDKKTYSKTKGDTLSTEDRLQESFPETGTEMTIYAFYKDFDLATMV